jgi:putative membrane protein
MIRYIASAIALSAAVSPVLAQTPPPAPPAQAKTQALAYVMAAGKSDLYEIDSSRIAQQKSQNPKVRDFAGMLIKHHQMTTAATLKAARDAGLNPSPPALDAGAERSIAELRAASPAEFDRLYLGQQVPAHQAALDLHQSYGAGGDKAPLRASAKTAVPIVKQHLDAATAMQRGGGGHAM